MNRWGKEVVMALLEKPLRGWDCDLVAVGERERREVVVVVVVVSRGVGVHFCCVEPAGIERLQERAASVAMVVNGGSVSSHSEQSIFPN